MAYTPTHSDLRATRPSFLARARTALSIGFTCWDEAYNGASRVAALTTQSDAELATVGLRREDIVRYAFLDRTSF